MTRQQRSAWVWILTRGWPLLWALGLGIVAWRSLPPYALDAFNDELPWLTVSAFSAAALSMLAVGVHPGWRLRLGALGIVVFAMALRVASLALLGGSDVDTRIVGVTLWSMLAVATVLLTMLAVTIGGCRARR